MAAAKQIDFNENIISSGEIEECLWNVNSEVFKDRHLRQNAIQRVAELFEMSGKRLLYDSPVERCSSEIQLGRYRLTHYGVLFGNIPFY